MYRTTEKRAVNSRHSTILYTRLRFGTYKVQQYFLVLSLLDLTAQQHFQIQFFIAGHNASHMIAIYLIFNIFAPMKSCSFTSTTKCFIAYEACDAHRSQASLSFQKLFFFCGFAFLRWDHLRDLSSTRWTFNVCCTSFVFRKYPV